MSWPNVIKKLQAGQTVTLHPKGNSMTPRITSGQEVVIVPRGETAITVGMVVLAKVKGRHYLHLVAATDHLQIKITGQHGHSAATDRLRIQIANNHGHVNGWTSVDKIYGIAQV